MPTPTALSLALLRGEISPAEHPPFAPLMSLESLGDSLAFVSSFANSTALRTTAGLVLFDTGSPFLSAQVYGALRKFTAAPVHTVVFTHGHVDHVFGVDRYESEPRPSGAAPLNVIAHERVSARFDRYKLTRGYNACINRRQFGASMKWPAHYRYPDTTYDRTHTLTVGDTVIELHHARGETDDHTWSWLPRERAVCTGDLFIWAMPNCGNPQKAQRYPREWALALRAMDALAPEILLPGHGPPIVGAADVHRALDETASLLESLVEQTLALMNQGASLDAVMHGVKIPVALLDRPYLRPTYDDPAFVIRAIWREFGGWWDGDPAHLKPAPEGRLAREVVALAGGAKVLADRALELADEGDLALAAQLAEWAARAAPRDAAIVRVRAGIYRARAIEETSLMAKGVFGDAAKRGGRGDDET